MYRCILADPPWPLTMSGQRKRSKEGKRPKTLPYPSMTVDQICMLPVENLAEEDCHLWLWTTNQHLPDGFKVMAAWGFKYLMPIHWIKPTGMGCWFIHRTQTLLFGYKKKCVFPGARYLPNLITTGDPKRHSEKPEETYEYIEKISTSPRLELFARRPRMEWDVWGNEVLCDIALAEDITIDNI